MELDLFIGRFHPLVVHLPIGFLLLAIIMELFSIKFPEKFRLYQAIKLTLVAGILGSIITIITGLLLSNEGSYDPDTLWTHKWMGITVLIISVFALLLKHYKPEYSSIKSLVVSGVFFVIISLTGHLGGVLTHGEDYLFQYAPDFVKQIAGIKIVEQEDLSSLHPDSINIYKHILQPVLNSKCVECHNSTKKEGKLILTTYNNLMIGGEDGVIVNSHDPYNSTLLLRVTLPNGHIKFMPPKGPPLSFGEIKILACWTNAGADSTVKFSDLKLNSEMIAIIDRDYNLDYNEKPFFEKMIVDPVPDQSIDQLEKAGYVVESLGGSNNMISLKFQSANINLKTVEMLELVKDQVTWLNLSKCDVSDDMISIIGEMNNITRLNLHSNPVTDEGISHITDLKHLESLNLYNTNLMDSGLLKIVKMENLKRLYIWQTKVTDEALAEAKKLNPDLSIDHGFNLTISK